LVNIGEQDKIAKAQKEKEKKKSVKFSEPSRVDDTRNDELTEFDVNQSSMPSQSQMMDQDSPPQYVR
jgi:hypothetical protein